MRLLLVRHGATLANEERRYIGQTDVALSALGVRQAARLGASLAPAAVDLVVTSDLQRARATAEAILRRCPVPLELDADLRELARGAWEGVTAAEVRERHADLWARWRRAPAQCQIPGGETLEQVRARVVRALERWFARAPQATVVWVTHAGVIQVLLCHLLEVDLNGWRQFYPENASITAVGVERVGGRLVGRLETPPAPLPGAE